MTIYNVAKNAVQTSPDILIDAGKSMNFINIAVANAEITDAVRGAKSDRETGTLASVVLLIYKRETRKEIR